MQENISIPCYKGEEPYIFVSYSSTDRQKVMAVLHWLDSQGYRLWHDEGEGFGKDFPADIAEAVKGSTQLLVFLSSSSMSQAFVRRELNYGIQLGKKILPIYIEEMDMPESLEFYKKAVQGIKKYELNEEYFRKYLMKAVSEDITEDIPEVCLEVWDYVTFGSYYGEPILWQCVMLDTGSPMLVSEHILCSKAFDAAESGEERKGADEVQQYGSNCWKSSNIREWLNSREQKVSYSTQPPTREAVCNNTNPYADEAGFLSNFTDEEYMRLKPVNNDGVEDLVYLLSEGELWLLSDTQKNLSEMAVKNSEYKLYSGAWYWWLRTPISSIPSRPRVIDLEGKRYGAPAYCCEGVVPVINLRSNIIKCSGGRGTKHHPYIII